MKKTGFIIVLLLSVLFIVSCEKDYLSTLPPEDNSVPLDTSKPVSFSENVLPMFIANCLGSGCHISGGISPVLTADKAYEQLTGLGYVDAATPDTIPENSKLYQRMTAKTKPMPPGGILSASKINALALWIKQGSNNN